MTETGIYQKALAAAIEQAANSQLAVKEHLRRLAFMKAERVYKECIGNELENEKRGTVKVIAVGYWTKKDVFELGEYNSTNKALQITVVLAADVQPLIDSKRKQLTKAERLELKKIQLFRKSADFYKNNPGISQYYEKYNDDVEHLRCANSEFRNRKNKLRVLDIATWTWSLTDILKDDFIEGGMIYNGDQILLKPIITSH